MTTEDGRPTDEEGEAGLAQPTAEQLNAWFAVLHRLCQLQFDDPLASVLAPTPLRPDFQDCVDRGWVAAWNVVGGAQGTQYRLLIRPEGRAMYKIWCEQLAELGRPVDPCWVRD